MDGRSETGKERLQIKKVQSLPGRLTVGNLQFNTTGELWKPVRSMHSKFSLQGLPWWSSG